MFPFTYGLACCAIEMLSSGFARYDVARYGMEVFRPTPRQCDLMIVAGTVNEKMAPVLKLLYEQMSEPKWVIAMGACATSGGPFYDGYNVVNGVDKIVPVDVYIPGCPPRPEALFQGLLELQKKIQAMRIVPPLPAADAGRRHPRPPTSRPRRPPTQARRRRAVGDRAREGPGLACCPRSVRPACRSTTSLRVLPPTLGADLPTLRVQEPDTVVAVVEPGRLHAVAVRLRELDGLAYESCNFIAAVDHGDRFEAVYHLYSFASNTYLELHVDVPRDKPVVPTVTDVWPAADWHEREAWDMMGIRFEGHPDLRRILLSDDWVGHPLRKDYVDSVENHPHA